MIFIYARTGDEAPGAVVKRLGSSATPCGRGGALPDAATGLLITAAGLDCAYGVADAVKRGLPVLGAGDGVHSLNLALGGGVAQASPGHTANNAPVRIATFLSPGGKVAHIVGGSGWVNVPCRHSTGLRPGSVAAGLLASSYTGDGVIESVEMPGRAWVIGVQWEILLPDALPRGFEDILIVFLERAAEQERG